jgi:flavin reductase (DIM6/NTAB) family NADH-FMN oxidoreductase RutF
MLFDFAKLGPNDTYKLLAATVVPRPIAWVVTQNPAGQLNAAPFSFFNVLSGAPPIVSLGIGNRSSGQPKDSLANIRSTRQFVVNLVSESMVRRMNVTAIDFAPTVDEVAAAQLRTSACEHVKPPRLADSPVALECELFQEVDIGEGKCILLARVLAVHIDDDKVLNRERCHVDTPNLELVGRMHGAGWYARTGDLFNIDRIPVADWNGSPEG